MVEAFSQSSFFRKEGKSLGLPYSINCTTHLGTPTFSGQTAYLGITMNIKTGSSKRYMKGTRTMSVLAKNIPRRTTCTVDLLKNV